MKTVYVCHLVPTKSSKDLILLGVFSSELDAEKAALIEINKPNASWWTRYSITPTVRSYWIKKLK